jgi:vitamin K-dependent gamma-carboxylase
MLKRYWKYLFEKLYEPVDISSVAFFRICFGAIMLWEVYRYYQAGWVWSQFMFPKMFFTYGGFEWIQPWENNGMVIHFMIMGILALFIMLGFLYRISAFLFFLSFTFIFLIDQTNYLNHFYLICLISFLLILIPAHRNYSIDAALRPHIKADTIPIWALWILLFQIGVAYFYGGVAKINPDWLQGEPMGIWLSKRAHLPYIGQYFRDQGVVIFMSRAGLYRAVFTV